MLYAEYNNATYIFTIRSGKIRLRSKKKEELFVELVDLAGNIHPDIFIKEVDKNDVSYAYELDYEAVYQGSRYKVNSVGKFLLHEPIILFSNDIVDMEKRYFRRIDKFIYEKEVPLEDIDTLIEYKKPILQYSHMEEEITVIDSNDIKQYLMQLIE